MNGIKQIITILYKQSKLFTNMKKLAWHFAIWECLCFSISYCNSHVPILNWGETDVQLYKHAQGKKTWKLLNVLQQSTLRSKCGIPLGQHTAKSMPMTALPEPPGELVGKPTPTCLSVAVFEANIWADPCGHHNLRTIALQFLSGNGYHHNW